jgi:cbb3-type cytochrome oxidase maturation protein
MTIIFFLIPISVLLAAGFLAAFIWAVRSGQYEDTCTPSMRVLMDQEIKTPGAQAQTHRNDELSLK